MKTILVSARIKPETYEAVKKAAATDRRLLGAYLRLVL